MFAKTFDKFGYKLQGDRYIFHFVKLFCIRTLYLLVSTSKGNLKNLWYYWKKFLKKGKNTYKLSFKIFSEVSSSFCWV